MNKSRDFIAIQGDLAEELVSTPTAIDLGLSGEGSENVMVVGNRDFNLCPTGRNLLGALNLK